MPLTPTEREFLNAYVHEATHEPFGGPATSDLRRRGICYSDLNWILTAFDRELRAQRIPPVGQFNPHPPSSPWPDLASARGRNQELQLEWQSPPNEPRKPDSVPPAGPAPPQVNPIPAASR
jgi:hypothetical protein